MAVSLGIPTPAFSSALAFYDGYRSSWLPANLLQVPAANLWVWFFKQIYLRNSGLSRFCSSFFMQLFMERTFEDKYHRIFMAVCCSCHPNNSVISIFLLCSFSVKISHNFLNVFLHYLVKCFMCPGFCASHCRYTHTRLMALCPGLPGWAGTRMVKPIWMLLKQETVSDTGIRWAICKSAPRCRRAQLLIM